MSATKKYYFEQLTNDYEDYSEYEYQEYARNKEREDREEAARIMADRFNMNDIDCWGV